MKKFDLELAVGVFMIIGILALGYISIKLGRLEVIGGKGYTIVALFEKAGGVKTGAVVEIAGVEIGKVKTVSLDDYRARVEIMVNEGIRIQDDAIASIKTKGLIGEKFIQISPGASDALLKNGDILRDTESAIDIEELISKYVFGKV